MSKWRKFMAVGCSHAQMMDRASGDFVLRFAREYKPHTIAHLGDFIDATAFMSSAHAGTRESAEDVDFDLATGLAFVGRLYDESQAARRVLLMGNHEDRLYRLARTPAAIVAKCARDCIGDIHALVEAHRAEAHEWTGNAQAAMLGESVRLMHGTVFNELAARDMAESYAPRGGTVIFSHTHRTADVVGRRSDGARAINAGWLGDPAHATYAKARRATLSWRNALVYGEYNDDSHVATLWQRAACGTWRMPR